ncbi:hypothetical protein DVH05_026948 [Phytophthora capsici]|nr:hypothetical protein DVH05_026948 [Phytophthora capsici]
MDEDYKLAKEAFVAGLQGTSAREVFLVFSIAPGSLWLYSELLLLLEVVGIRQLGAGNSNLVTTILLEFVVTVMPTMIGFSFAEYTVPLLAVVYVLAAVLSALSRFHAKEFIRKHCRKAKMNELLKKELPFLTNFRAQIMISTCFAILAVDFTVFPRRFAKTENYGFSVMDIGVGAFIVSSAIVSAPARQARLSASTNRSQQTQTFMMKCYAFLRPIALVLVFGIARFLTVKGVNYQEHVSEYGVHWNFYFTLAGVYIMYRFLGLFGNLASSPVVAAIVAFGYQLYLSHYGGEEYILHAPRDNLMSQNREGILSLAGMLSSIPKLAARQRLMYPVCCPGYTSLYMLAVYAGQSIFGYMDSNGSKLHRNMRWLTITLVVVAGFLWLSTFLSVRLVARPSRRMVRIPHL